MKSTVPFGKHARCYRPVCYRYAAAGHKGSQKSYRGPGTANSLFCGRERAGKYQNKTGGGYCGGKAPGGRFGSEPRVMPECFPELYQAWRDKKISLREATECCGIPKSTFYDAAIRLKTDACKARSTK